MLNQSNRDNKASVGPAGSLAIWARWLCTVLAVLMGLQGSVVQAQTVYYHNDAAGSPLAASDAAGNLLWRESYRPYGERMLKPAAANSQWFHGKRADPDTGLQDFGARNYDPVLGRFLSIDPMDYSAENIHSFNRYAYGNNNPLKFKDPDGNIPLLIPIAIIATRMAIATAARQFATRAVSTVAIHGARASIMAAEVAAGEALGGASLVGGAAAVAAKSEAAFFRGAKAGEAPSFVPRAGEFRVDSRTGLVKDTHGVSVFDNPLSVSSKGLTPHRVDQSSTPDSLRIIQRGNDLHHFEIVPKPGANLTPQQFINACSSIVCVR